MLTDLTKLAGLAVAVDATSGRLQRGDGVSAEESGVREIAAACEVYTQAPPDAAPLYHMENGLRVAGLDDPDPRLRYELTSLRPGVVGCERVKTMGHVHAPVADGLGHPELYEVLCGVGAFPLFRERASGGWECVLVDAAAGERFVIPPGWHHLAINAGEQAMVFADIVARTVVPDYSVPRTRVGAPIRIGPDRVGSNPSYASDGSFVRVCAHELPMPIDLDRGPLWPQFARAPRRFAFLLQPTIAAATWKAFDALVAAAPATPLSELDRERSVRI